MSKHILILGCLGLALGAGACGKDKKSEAGSGEANKADDAPALDCAGFATKMNECLDPFAEAYSKTEFGQQAGKNLDGTVDHAAAAERFKMLWSLEGEKICSGGAAMGSYVDKDPRWKKRFAACDNTAACDVWVPCMSTAVGELLP